MSILAIEKIEMSRNCPCCNGLHFSLSIITCSISREIRVASEDFSLEVSERKFTLTLGEWEQKLEVPNPHGNDLEGPDLEKPFLFHGPAQREQIALGNSTLQCEVKESKGGFLCPNVCPVL